MPDPYTSPDDFSRQFPVVDQDAWFRLGSIDEGGAVLSGTRVFWCGLRTSFDNSRAWALHQVGEGDEGAITAARATWRRDLDLPAFQTIHVRLQHPWPYPPTIETTHLELHQDAVRSALDLLRSCPAPPFEDRNIVVDGHTWFLRLPDRSPELDVSWWCQPPPVWSELAEVLRRLLDTIDPNSREALERYW
jgi:hypothetical protein